MDDLAEKNPQAKEIILAFIKENGGDKHWIPAYPQGLAVIANISIEDFCCLFERLLKEGSIIIKRCLSSDFDNAFRLFVGIPSDGFNAKEFVELPINSLRLERTSGSIKRISKCPITDNPQM